MKTKQDFQECIQSQEARILKIKVSPLFSEQEKNDMVAECRQEIERINRLQLALAHRELKRTKRAQFFKLRGCETMAITTVLFILFSISAKSQAYMSFEAQSKGYGLNAGGIVNQIDFKAGYNHPFTDKAKSSIVYGSIGYGIFLSDLDNGNFILTPSAGYALYHTTDFSKYDVGEVINKGAPFVAIEIGKNFITGGGYNYGRYYVFANHAVETFIGVGLRVFIK
jgi:hypothetical protein